MANHKALADTLRARPALEDLYSMASTVASMIVTSDSPGALLVAHLVLLSLAREFDSEPVSEAGWEAANAVLRVLADLIESPDVKALNSVGDAWRDWKRPPALQ